MTQFGDIPPLPSPHTYQREIFHLVTEQNFDSSELIAEEVEKRRQDDYRFRGYLGKIATMSGQITKHSRSDDSLYDQGAGDAFTTGAVFGTFLAERIHGKVVSLDELTLALPQPMILDQPTSRKQVQRSAAIPYVIEGIIGYQLLIGERSKTLLEPLERRIVSDDTKRYFFNVGLGLILLAADTVHRSKLNGADWIDPLDNDN